MSDQSQVVEARYDGFSEWKPSRATVLAWNILSIPIVAIAAAAYLLVARGEIPTSGTVNLSDVAVVLALTLALACVHEGVHGVAIAAFGARPAFGMLMIKHVFPAFYATAPGYRFSRRQYLVIALAPLAVLTPLGILACSLSFGDYLAIPFGILLAGCIADVTIAWLVLRAPSDVTCEDLRDGVRLWRAAA
jgi:hypothetical protein